MGLTPDDFEAAAKALAEANGLPLDRALAAMADIGDTPEFDQADRVIWIDPETGIKHALIWPEEAL